MSPTTDPLTDTLAPTTPLTLLAPRPGARDLLRHDEAIARAAVVADVRYDLEIAFTAGAGSFEGRIGIDLAVPAGTSAEALAAGAFLCFRGTTLRSLRVNGTVVEAPDWDGYRLRLPVGLLRPGASNRIEAAYENAFDRGGDGVFRFVDPEDGREYVYTNFEPYESHRLAPLFDQSDIKGRLTLRVVAPAAWVVLANGPADGAPVPLPDGRVRHAFAENPPLSSYLFSVAAGEWVGRRRAIPLAGRSDQLEVGVWGRRSLERHLDPDRIVDLTAVALPYYDRLFGRPYPFAKLDHVFCPEFATGAMENVGLITYHEDKVFRSTPTPADLQALAEVVFHELAHMWFGDLVTMRWWDDLWLNEAFATYCSYLCLDEAAGDPSAWSDFSISLKRWALAEDEAPTTHPIASSGVADTDQTFLNFDGITYGKGAAVLRQLGARLGADGLRAGLRRYLERHEYGNATLADFLAALEAGSGIALGAWSDAWLRTSGPNRLGATIEPAADGRIGRLLLTQSVDSGDDILRPHRLGVALVRDGNGGGRLTIEAHEVLLEGTSVEVPAAAGTPLPLAVIANHGDLAFGKLALDPAAIALAETRLEELPDPLLRQIVWTALWSGVRDGSYDARAYGRLVATRLPAEPETTIVQNVVSLTVRPLLSRWLGDDDRADMGETIGAAARRALAATEDEAARIVWSRALCYAAVTPETVEAAWTLGTDDSSVAGTPLLEVDQEHRWLLLVRAASFGVPGSEERLAAEAKRDPSDRGARARLTASVASPDPTAKAAAWERFGDPASYGSVVRTLAAAAGFALPWQHELTAPYVEQLPDLVLSLGSADPTYVRNLLTNALAPSGWGDPERLADALRTTLRRLGDPASAIGPVEAARLRRLVASELDLLERIVRQRRVAGR